MNKALTILIIVLVAFAGIALWRSQSPETALESPTPSLSLAPGASATPTPSPAQTAQQWLWHQGQGYRVAYPAIFAETNTKIESVPLGSSGQTVAMSLRVLGSRGYLAIGVIDRPLDSSASAIDGEPVRNQTTIDTPLGKGVRFEMGNQECGATVYYAPLNGKTLRLGFAACNDTQNRLDRDFELHTGIISTLEPAR